ncbi:MAG TPA: WG repeat-containing protein, partial [bacterium]|nr:WG repeat-containing protein [bacterium]
MGAIVGVVVWEGIYRVESRLTPGWEVVAAGIGDTLLPAPAEGRWGFINQRGQWVIAPRFREVGRFREGVAPASWRGLFGFIDRRGEWVIKPVFDVAYPFSEGLARVMRNGYCQYVDRAGQVVAAPPGAAEGEDFRDGLVRVACQRGDSPHTFWHRNRYWGLMDRRGRWVVAPRYKEIGDMRDGRIVLQADSSAPDPDRPGKWRSMKYSVVDRQGRVVVEAGRFFRISPYYRGVAAVVGEKAGEVGYYGVIDTAGRLLVEWRLSSVEEAWSEAARTYYSGGGRGLECAVGFSRDRVLVWRAPTAADLARLP